MRKVLFCLVLIAIILCPTIALADTTDLQLDCKSALLMEDVYKRQRVYIMQYPKKSNENYT